MFDTFYGHEPIKAYLQKALQEDTLPQTMLFVGPEGVGKALFAIELAGRLLNTSRINNHPDLHLVRPEGKSGLHAIDSLRTLISQVYEAPYEAPGKVAIIYDAERMQAPSANALLKTLEEPPLTATLILLTSQPQDILPTILSRCIRLNFKPLPEAAIASILTTQNLPPHFATLAHGSAAAALLLAQDSSLKEMQNILFDLLSKKIFYPDLCDGLEKIESLLEPLKEEEPVAYHRRVDLLFSTLLMWARDQVLRPIGGSKLFFPDQPPSISALSLSAFDQTVQEARSAFQRNIKLSACLEKCLFACHK
jgi:DNA polymerase-3 subunit delta'